MCKGKAEIKRQDRNHTILATERFVVNHMAYDLSPMVQESWRHRLIDFVLLTQSCLQTNTKWPLYLSPSSGLGRAAWAL